MISFQRAVQITVPFNTRILLVEDSFERIKWFRQQIGEQFVVGTTPERALDAIGESAPYDLVFLDHDAKLDNPKITFYTVAEKLAALKFAGVVVIHSYNPVGAARMAKLLKESTPATVSIYPFGTFAITRPA
jgi:predicted O-methyltransferase YrrM